MLNRCVLVCEYMFRVCSYSQVSISTFIVNNICANKHYDDDSNDILLYLLYKMCIRKALN